MTLSCVDLHELKRMLEIDPDDTQEDVRLNFWIRIAAGLVEGWCRGRVRLLQQRTEYYNGTGTQKLLLKTTPVYTDAPDTTPYVLAPQVWYDETAAYGANLGAFADAKKLTYGTDYALWVQDGDANKSTNGILLRINSLWNKTYRRQTGFLFPYVDNAYGVIKVVYTAGNTADDLPQEVVAATVLTVSTLRFMMPLGLPLTGDSWEGKNIQLKSEDKNYLFGQAKRLLQRYTNRRM